jgi:hypothetical protein
MWNHFELIPFLVGLAAGAFIFFYIKPEAQEKVIKWPHPSNAGQVVYRDRNGLCYTFEAQIVDCGKVKESLETYAFE